MRTSSIIAAIVGMHERQGHKCHVQRADVEAGLLVRVSDLICAALMDMRRSAPPPSSPADHGGRRGPPLSAMEGPRGPTRAHEDLLFYRSLRLPCSSCPPFSPTRVRLCKQQATPEADTAEPELVRACFLEPASRDGARDYMQPVRLAGG
jgi:hypothetical protein